MKLPFTDETIDNANGTPCRVLDSSRVDFQSAAFGRKTALTLVKKAEGGEATGQNFKDGPEGAEYVAQPGDAIFINSPDDIYVPGNKDGSRLQYEDLEAKGYEKTRESTDGDGILVKSPTAPLLVKVVDEPICIKDAWGAGQHQFLYPGATLKLNDGGAVTGINKDGFDGKWEVVTPRL